MDMFEALGEAREARVPGREASGGRVPCVLCLAKAIVCFKSLANVL